MKNNTLKISLILLLILILPAKFLLGIPPTISSFTPLTGSIGTLITITGTNFPQTVTITVGGGSAIPVSISGNRIVAMIIAGATTGIITMITPTGISSSSNSFTVMESQLPITQQGNKLGGTITTGPSNYGSSVCLSADGNTAIIGGPEDSGSDGAAWIYTRKDGVWTQDGNKLVGNSIFGYAKQGFSVSISAEGNTALIGGYNDNSGQGAAWVFVKSGGNWVQQAKLIGTGSSGTPHQGYSVSLSANGNTAIVGGYSDNNGQGAAWIFIRQSNSIWSQQGDKLIGTGNIGAALQGISVSLSANGNTAIIGGVGNNGNQGAAWVFGRYNGVWTEKSKLIGPGSIGVARQGHSVGLSADGNVAILGGYTDSSNHGAAWVFDRINGIWNQQGHKLANTGDTGAALLGCSVSLSADGNTALLGGYADSNNYGASWVYKRTAGVWAQAGIKLRGTGNAGQAQQGFAVALSSDGNTAIIGGNKDSNYYGAAWLLSEAPFANLSALTISAGNLEPAFATAVVSYSDSVGYEVASISLTAITVDTGANMQARVNGGIYKNMMSGIALDSLNLNVGINTIEIKVSAQNGTVIKMYTIYIIREVANANLIALTISSGILSPVFATQTTTYIVRLNYVISSITLRPTAALAASWIQVSVNGGSYASITNGGISNPLLLNIGSNVIVLKVTAPDSSVINFYTITVTRILPPTITSFSPLVGPVGSLVTINGTNLNNPTALTICGVTAIIVSNSGNRLVALLMPGAISGNISITTIGGNVSSNPFIVVPSQTPFSQQGNKLIGTGNAGASWQGSSIDLSADGNTVITSGYNDSNDKGATWVFTRNGNVWSQQGGKLVGSGNIGGAHQGSSISLSADGNTAIIGGFYDDIQKGAAWIFTRKDSIWTQQGNKLVGSGNIGAASLGSSVDLSADGNTAIIGGYNDNFSQGAAWVFVRNAGVWKQQGNKLAANAGAAQGISVSLSADGNTAIVGGYGDSGGYGAAWVYTRSGEVWTQQGNKLFGTGNTGLCAQGYSVCLSADGNTAIVGGNNDSNGTGASWVFIRNAGVWTQQGNKLKGSGNIGAARQGSEVRLSADGNKAIIGGSGDNGNRGATWIFTRKAGVWTQQGSKLIGTGSIGSARQGQSVALSSDGNTALIGGYGDNFYQGAIWVYAAAPLSSIAGLNNLIINTGTLTPVFNNQTINYTDSVDNATLSIKVTPVITDATGNILVRINNASYTAVTSGSASGPLPLNVGSNIIEIKVTAQDGITIKTYTINVTRSAPSTYLPGVHNQVGFKVYPNPTPGLINIELKEQNDAETNVKVYDARGKLFYETIINTTIAQINLRTLSDGSYFIRLSQEGKTSVKPILILGNW